MSEDAQQLLDESITRTGFYPEVVRSAVREGLMGENPSAHLVHLETHIDNAEIHRHVTVLALTDRFLLVAHLDDQQLDEEGSSLIAHVTVDTVPLGELRSVGMSFSYPQPQDFSEGTLPSEVSLAIAWTGGQRVDLQPAQCPDPMCTADHGLTGVAASEDVVLRVSATADGEAAVTRARSFAQQLRIAQLGAR